MLHAARSEKKTRTREVWTLEEEQKYVNFLIENKKEKELTDQSPPGHQKDSIYGQMAIEVETKDHLQCSAHHRYCLKKFKSLNAIIKERIDSLKSKKKKENELPEEEKEILIKIKKEQYALYQKGSEFRIELNKNVEFEEW